jgi:hypothetical protein
MGIVSETENPIINIDWNGSQSASGVTWNILC